MSERIWLFVAVTGLFLSIVGVFLPWSEQGPHLRTFTPDLLHTVYGYELFLGIYALVGCAIDGASILFFKIGLKRLWCSVMLVGGLITLVCSLTWILAPGAVASSSFIYGIPAGSINGVHICLIGSILTSTVSILYHLQNRTDDRSGVSSGTCERAERLTSI